MQQSIRKPSEAERARWFSTGFLASGVGAVLPELHTLQDAAVIRCGEARGHDLWVDSVMCGQVMTHGNALGDKGVKARFGHPDMCADALGTFLGRWKNLKAGADGIVRGDLHLSSTAAESPKGDLRNYIEQMAAKEPGHFGTSIVFTRDWEAEEDFACQNGAVFVFGKLECGPFGCGIDEAGRCSARSEIPAGMDYYVDMAGFKSPDPLNTSNYPHARVAALHAADLVDDPAATDGMFSGAGGAALAARVSEWLDTHPEVLKAFGSDAEILGVLERYAGQIRPFVDRYNANHPTAPAEPGSEPSPSTAPAEPDAALSARIHELESLLSSHTQEAQAEVERLKSANDGLSADLSSARAERDALATDNDRLTAELATVQQKLAEQLSGQTPASAVAAPEEPAGDFWTRVRKSSKTTK